MTKLSYTNYGTYILVRIEGDSHEAVEQQFNSFWNWKASNRNADWIEDYICEFWTTNEKLLAAMTNAALFKILNANPKANKGQKGGALAQARIDGQATFDGMEKSRNLSYLQRSSYTYGMGSITAEKEDAHCNDRD